MHNLPNVPILCLVGLFISNMNLVTVKEKRSLSSTSEAMLFFLRLIFLHIKQWPLILINFFPGGDPISSLNILSFRQSQCPLFCSSDISNFPQSRAQISYLKCGSRHRDPTSCALILRLDVICSDCFQSLGKPPAFVSPNNYFLRDVCDLRSLSFSRYGLSCSSLCLFNAIHCWKSILYYRKHYSN